MNYLIPANSKKSLLLFGLFTWFDLALFGIGVASSLLLLTIISPADALFALLDLMPAAVSAFLVMPIPNYHNTLTLLKDLYRFFTTRQKFIWKGWCVSNEYKEEK